MKKTNQGLVTFAEKAHLEKWGYVWGTFGNVLTLPLFNQKILQYPDMVGRYKDIIAKRWVGRRTADCIGLIKGYLWWDGQKINYKADTDVNANKMYALAVKKGLINTLPEVQGLCLWKKGHIGVYIGGGWVIEAHGTSSGVIKTPLSGKGATPWTHWLECPFIDYETSEQKTSGKTPEIALKPDVFDTALQYLVDSQIINSPEVWKDGAVAGGTIKGEYARQLILNVYEARKRVHGA